MNEWKNAWAVLKQHNKIPSKTQCSFIQSDIESFCPSITRELMNKAVEFAKTIVDIPDEDLYRDEDFDVPIGYNDGAEVYKIVGSYEFIMQYS